MTEIKAALTAEEWALPLADQLNGYASWETGIVDIVVSGPKDRHRPAALALYDQPFGFTREDLKWLRRMQFTTFDPEKANAHQKWLQSLLARIESLLPPEDVK